jgi:hypothetical protein
MLGTAKQIYLATRKKHDQLWNIYVMRPLAAGVVAAIARTPITPNQLTLLNLGIFVAAAGMLVALPTYEGALAAILVLELSYLFDCADGMLARHKKLASKVGHLFDFFTDELKAVLLTAGIGVYLYRAGGLGIDLSIWEPKNPFFLFGTVGGVAVIASATSLTNFIRRPELTGKETPVEAHYETVDPARAGLFMTFLRFLIHYPSHIWIFAIAGRLDVFFWMYVALNLLYLARGWLGLVVRFGRF